MPRSARLTLDPVVEPTRLSTAARERLAAEVFAVHCEIFDGLQFDSFRRYVLEPPSAETRLQVMRDPEGKAAGYIAIHSYVHTIDDRPTLIVRSEVGVVRKWRGHAPQARFVLEQCLRLCIRHLGKPKLIFACPIHPSSYWGVTRRAPRSWPRPDMTTPASVHAAMMELADAFGLPPVADADPMVRRVGWITRETADDRNFWADHSAPLVRYYRQLNPDYASGNGLLFVAPLTIELVVVGAWRQLGDVVRKAWRSLRQPSRAQA